MVEQIQTSENEPKKAKSSKFAVISLILSFLSLFLWLFAAVPAIALGITGIIKINKSNGMLKGRKLAYAGIIISVVFVGLIYVWHFDAEPIENDYTIADLRSAPEEFNESYEVLLRLEDNRKWGKGASPAIGLAAEDVNMLDETFGYGLKDSSHSALKEVVLKNADAIYIAWENGKIGREVIAKLDSFEEIADLTVPSLEADLKHLQSLRDLVRLYRAYVFLKVEEGNFAEAVSALGEINSVIRKLSVNGRLMITKMVCYAWFGANIETANYIVNQPDVSRESLEVLAGHFKPLSEDEISLRNSFISEYLMFKDGIIKTHKNFSTRRTVLSKMNSTLKLYRSYLDIWIKPDKKRISDKGSVWPEFYPDLPEVSIDKIPWYYKCYNPIAGTCVPLLEGRARMETKTKVRDEIFQIVLNTRLGKKVSLKASAYVDEYIVDLEGRIIYCPVQQNKQGCVDGDIKLEINPEVLGFK